MYRQLHLLEHKSELQWLVDTFELRRYGSMPKSQTYDLYSSMCTERGLTPVCQAVFGKLMKRAFPTLMYNRKGARGNTQHHYLFLHLKENGTNNDNSNNSGDCEDLDGDFAGSSSTSPEPSPAGSPIASSHTPPLCHQVDQGSIGTSFGSWMPSPSTCAGVTLCGQRGNFPGYTTSEISMHPPVPESRHLGNPVHHASYEDTYWPQPRAASFVPRNTMTRQTAANFEIDVLSMVYNARIAAENTDRSRADGRLQATQMMMNQVNTSAPVYAHRVDINGGLRRSSLASPASAATCDRYGYTFGSAVGVDGRHSPASTRSSGDYSDYLYPGRSSSSYSAAHSPSSYEACSPSFTQESPAPTPALQHVAPVDPVANFHLDPVGLEAPAAEDWLQEFLLAEAQGHFLPANPGRSGARQTTIVTEQAVVGCKRKAFGSTTTNTSMVENKRCRNESRQQHEQPGVASSIRVCFRLAEGSNADAEELRQVAEFSEIYAYYNITLLYRYIFVEADSAKAGSAVELFWQEEVPRFRGLLRRRPELLDQALRFDDMRVREISQLFARDPMGWQDRRHGFAEELEQVVRDVLHRLYVEENVMPPEVSLGHFLSRKLRMMKTRWGAQLLAASAVESLPSTA